VDLPRNPRCDGGCSTRSSNAAPRQIRRDQGRQGVCEGPVLYPRGASSHCRTVDEAAGDSQQAAAIAGDTRWVRPFVSLPAPRNFGWRSRRSARPGPSLSGFMARHIEQTRFAASRNRHFERSCRGPSASACDFHEPRAGARTIAANVGVSPSGHPTTARRHRADPRCAH